MIREYRKTFKLLQWILCIDFLFTRLQQTHLSKNVSEKFWPHLHNDSRTELLWNNNPSPLSLYTISSFQRQSHLCMRDTVRKKCFFFLYLFFPRPLWIHFIPAPLFPLDFSIGHIQRQKNATAINWNKIASIFINEMFNSREHCNPS